MKQATILKDLQVIPGVGKSIAQDLVDLQIYSVADLKGKDPDALYQHLCDLQGHRLDPCLLYVFRCAVYFSSTADPDPELLKWWNWKDRELPVV